MDCGQLRALLPVGIMAIALWSCDKKPPESMEGSVPGPATHPALQTDRDRTLGQVGAIAFLVYEFDSVYGRLPATFEELTTASPKYHGPAEGLLDAWGHMIRLSVSGDSFVVRSNGGDATKGTSDDIVYLGYSRGHVNR